MRFVRAVAAGLVLVGLVVGLPVVLYVLGGSPVPDQLPAWEEVRGVLSRPDTTGQVLMVVLKIAGWAAWATFAVSAVTELVSQIGRRPAPCLRGLGVQQRVAAGLVAALLGLATAQAALAIPTHAVPPTPAAVTLSVTEVAGAVLPSSAVVAPEVAQVAHQAVAPDRTDGTVVYTVVDGDSLWKIAQSRLGDPHRWTEVYELNVGVVQADGYALDDAGWVEPGWRLVLPADAQAPPVVVEHAYTVQPGDTLSQIAKDELGEANRYPEIFAASTGTVQPDGRHLVDPDLIYPGWQVTVPGTAAPDVPDSGAGTVPQVPGRDLPTDEVPVVPPQTVDQVPDRSEAAGQDVVGQDVVGGDVRAADGSPERAGAGGARAVSDSGARPGGAQQSGVPEWAPWVLVGLTGGGAVLAGSLWLVLQARRRARWRHRRPGRALEVPGPLLAPVARTVVAVGPGPAETVGFLDAVLRRMGAVVAAGGGAMPDLVAVELTGEHVVLHLGGPWDLGDPWEDCGESRRWRVPVGLDLGLVGPAGDHPAPYPLLVTVGTSDAGSLWLFNLEDLAVTLTGDCERARDFGRYLVAEVGCSPWAAWTRVDCVGLGAELVGLNPDRICYHHPGAGGDPVGEALAEALATVDRADAAGTDVVTARSVGVGTWSWSPRVVLVDASSDDPALDPLLEVLAARAGRTATSVVVAGSRPGGAGGGVRIEVGADGRVYLPEVGLDLVAVGLDITEAAGCAGLVAHAETAVDPVPVPGLDGTVDTGWRSWSDAAGALRPEHTAPRTPDAWPDPPGPSSVLPAPDATYLDVAATTAEDLAVLAPRVPAEVRQEVLAADPRLDEDLAAWYDPAAPYPKVQVLGPVQVVACGTPPTRREPFFTELVTYLALHPDGVNGAQVAEALDTSRAKAREYLQTVQRWLGTDPVTGQPYLPDAQPQPGRPDPTYQVGQALVDLDLLRRLRVRAQARGAEGTDDLLAALRLVVGRPFDDPAAWRPGGWAWLVEDRIDEAALIAIIDTAHTVITGALATTDAALVTTALQTARWAAQAAQAADPDAEIIHLDLAAIASAEGRHAEAARIVAHDIGNRTDDEHPPPELPDRTQQIIAAHPDWRTRAS